MNNKIIIVILFLLLVFSTSCLSLPAPAELDTATSTEVITFSTFSEDKEMLPIDLRCRKAVNEVGAKINCFVESNSQDFTNALSASSLGDNSSLETELTKTGLSGLDLTNVVNNISAVPVSSLSQSITPDKPSFNAVELASGRQVISFTIGKELVGGEQLKFGFNSEIIIASVTSFFATDFSSQRNITRNTDGSEIYVVYQSDDNIYFTDSNTNGLTWSEPIALDSSGFSGYPSIHYEPTESVIRVAYSSDFNIVYRECRQLDFCDVNLSYWSDAIDVAFVPGFHGFDLPSISAFSYDTFVRIEIGFFDDEDAAFYIVGCSDSAGQVCSTASSWDNLVLIAGSGFQAESPAVSVGFDGNFYFSYALINPVDFDWDIHYASCNAEDQNCNAASSWKGTIESDPIVLTNNGGADWRHSSITSTLDGNRHIVFESEGAGEIYYMTCGNGLNCKIETGEYWTTPVQIDDTGGTNGGDPVISRDSDGNIFVLWTSDWNGGNKEIFMRSCKSSLVDCSVAANWDNNIMLTNQTSEVYGVSSREIIESGAYWKRLDYVWTDSDDFIDNNVMFDSNLLNPVEWGGGTGTFADPFLLSNCFQLQMIEDYLDANFKQDGGNIDCNVVPFNVSPFFTSIGGSFKGAYDGQDYNISNLIVYSNSTSDTQTGLFTQLHASSDINNVHLVDVNIVGGQTVGGLAGTCSGDLYNVSTAGNVRGIGTANTIVGGVCGSIGGDSNLISSSATVWSRTSFVGGLYGSIASLGITTHDQSFFEGIIYCDGNCSFVGGFTGAIGRKAIITNSYSTGLIDCNTFVVNRCRDAGGFFGRSYLGDSGSNQISNCYSTGDIYVKSSIDIFTGGFGGRLGVGDNILNSFSTGRVYSDQNSGGFLGKTDSNTLVSNSFWDTTLSNNTTMCESDSGSTCDDSNGIAESIYFYSSINQPLTEWDFTNIWDSQPINYPKLSFEGAGNFADVIAYEPTGTISGTNDIKFFVKEGEGDNLIVNLYYSVTAGTKQTLIFNDTNLADGVGITCDSYDFTTTSDCTYSWNTISISNAIRFVDVSVTDNDGETISSTNQITIDNFELNAQNQLNGMIIIIIIILGLITVVRTIRIVFGEGLDLTEFLKLIVFIVVMAIIILVLSLIVQTIMPI